MVVVAAARLQVAMAAGVEETLPLPAVVLGVPSGQVVVGLSCRVMVLEHHWFVRVADLSLGAAVLVGFRLPRVGRLLL